MYKLLIIDDDVGLSGLMADFLGNHGFQCRYALDGDAGLAAIEREGWDVVILDVMLPGKSGHDVLRILRSDGRFRDLPVLMLTARGEEDDKVMGLNLGADDYLSKPFSAKELAARLHALLRRTRMLPRAEEQDEGLLILDDLEIDKASLTVVRDGSEVEITAPELCLLTLFSESPGKVVERDVLYREIFGHPPFAQDRSLDMMISRLRKKLGVRRDGKERIRAVRGHGYMFLLSGKEA